MLPALNFMCFSFYLLPNLQMAIPSLHSCFCSNVNSSERSPFPNGKIWKLQTSGNYWIKISAITVHRTKFLQARLPGITPAQLLTPVQRNKPKSKGNPTCKEQDKTSTQFPMDSTNSGEFVQLPECFRSQPWSSSQTLKQVKI